MEEKMENQKAYIAYNYFVKDTAEFEQFADFEPITNLTAEEAVRTLIELNIKKGLSAGIGINIPDDFIFDDPDGNGAIIFMKTNDDDEYSFYVGNNFVKELKENNEHAQNVIAAFKELDNVIKTSVLGDIEVYEEPDFLYAKEKELFGDNKMEKYNPDFKKTVSEQLLKNNNEVTADELKNARALLPKEQYQLVLSYTQGEEGEHFKGIIKEISSKAEAIKGKREILTEDKKHPLAFKYTLGNSRFYFSEWDGGDELYGYVVLNGDTQNSEWGYTSLEELKNSGGKARNGFPIMPEMIFYGLEDTIEKQISVDYPELSEQMGIKPKLNHNEELISEFGKKIFETLQSRKLEKNTYNICCAAQFVIRTMDSSEQKEIFSIMKKCGCEGKNGKENTEDFLNEVFNSESKTASAMYSRNRLYEKINNACSSKKKEENKNIHSPESDYNIYK